MTGEQVKRIEGLYGKIIAHEGVGDDGDQVVIRFTDGTWACFEGEGGGCDDPLVIYLATWKPSDDALYDAGVLSEEEYGAIKKERAESEQARRRREWEKLQKEFGGKTEEKGF